MQDSCEAYYQNLLILFLVTDKTLRKCRHYNKKPKKKIKMKKNKINTKFLKIKMIKMSRNYKNNLHII